MRFLFRVVFVFLAVFLGLQANAQKLSDEGIKTLIQALKADPRGPYLDLRWFCPDGTTVGPQERCAEKGGVQHARLKPKIIELQKSNGLYFGQILTGTDKESFWNPENGNTRLKQYQLERYLKSVDNGWILRRGQYYRGALQAEDEEAWGVAFYDWLLAQDHVLDEHFYLIRQSLKDIPHKGDDNLSQKIRSQSKLLSETMPSFMDIRVKIHSQPDESDVQRVKDFVKRNNAKLDENLSKDFAGLIQSMEQYYKPIDLNDLEIYLARLPAESAFKANVTQFMEENLDDAPSLDQLSALAQLQWETRLELKNDYSSSTLLDLLELSLKFEEIIFRISAKVETPELNGLLQKVSALALASAGSGSLEIWEWEQLSLRLKHPTEGNMKLGEVSDFLSAARSAVEWSVSLTKVNYEDVIEVYQGFEPLVKGFMDDRIRSSVGLVLGENVAILNDFIARESGLQNEVFKIANQGQIRGLNPGYSLGELVIVEGSSEQLDVSSDKIYLFQRAPADLKPVAGIATVNEGNLVSHVQLLARNLGIPNAVFSNESIKQLSEFAGRKVFYAVSLKGTVVMKLEEEMTEQERALFAVKQRKEELVSVNVELIKLDQLNVINLRDVRASDSGKSCGPKAANLGQLKSAFPENVVEGLVIPFGIFKTHMDQMMPDRDLSYWQFLTQIFEKGHEMRQRGASQEDADAFELGELAVLREAIKAMPLMPSFVLDLQKSFETILGAKIGDIPVFLRSDTNMEDLKDFTGAGLNLTLFNVLDAEKIMQGIREVWASPYSERSYKWRQKFLLNPVNVYPSILVIPSVDVDYSGVLITKGITNGVAEDLTVAFSRGAGGAVDGQSAETRLLKMDGTQTLLSPSRENQANRLLKTGGTAKEEVSLTQAILNAENIETIVELSKTLRKILPTTPGISSAGPYDVELGFKDNNLWLFQVRPFVENKRAQSSDYLESISPIVSESDVIALDTKL